MNGKQFRRECERLGLSTRDLAADLEIPPDTITEWKRSAVPRRYTREVAWHIVAAERDAALARSGLPECEWMQRWEAAYDASVHLPVDRKFEEELDEMRAHPQGCDVCTRREQFLLDKFGPMPDYPGNSGFRVPLLAGIIDVFRDSNGWRRVALIAAVVTSLFGIARFLPHLPRSWQLVFVAFVLAYTAGIILMLGIYGGMKSLHGSAFGRWLARCAAGVAAGTAFFGALDVSGFGLGPVWIFAGPGVGMLGATFWPLFEAWHRLRGYA